MRDTFNNDYVCEDCGREWLSVSAMMNCNCDRYDANGYEKQARGTAWIP